MALFIIASVVELVGDTVNTIGYKILNTKDGSFNLLKESSIRESNLTLENAEFKNNSLVGTMGDLKRYTKLNVFKGKCTGGRSIVILGKNTEGQYLLVTNPEIDDTKKIIDRVSLSELKYRIKISDGTDEGVKVANARIDDSNGIVIRPIKGTFKVIEKCPTFIEKDFDFGAKQENHSAKWKVRVVNIGEPYGVNYCLINEKEAFVEFYDLTQDVEKFPIGQFVSRYNLKQLLELEVAYGLALYASIDTWSLTSEALKEVVNWLNTLAISDKLSIE